MRNLSASVLVLIAASVMLFFFSSVSYAFTPIDTTFDTVPAFGFTPTPVPPGPGDQPSGSRPPSIPEPTTIILTGLGLAGLAGYAHRRKNKNDSSDE